MCATPFWQSTHREIWSDGEETIQEANHSDDSLPVTQGEDEHEEQPTEVEQLDEAEEIERIEPTVHKEDGIETTCVVSTIHDEGTIETRFKNRNVLSYFCI
ncbi:Hypothetical predicted protein [Mytilus galloprovincialis]|uniref:Uncharacterized protein n=1 Tax=Mytilus galloprovincialis TaxID=29158 RepID=A0A8B6CNX3_MYTGA|nr:Hypothetical predicted protein [Mytilus galloprovincialis]